MSVSREGSLYVYPQKTVLVFLRLFFFFLNVWFKSLNAKKKKKKCFDELSLRHAKSKKCTVIFNPLSWTCAVVPLV